MEQLTDFRHKDEEVRLGDSIGPYLARNKVFADLNLKDIKPFMATLAQKIQHFWQKPYKRGNKFLTNQRASSSIRSAKNVSLNNEPDSGG